jgi:hypothetical protein
MNLDQLESLEYNLFDESPDFIITSDTCPVHNGEVSQVSQFNDTHDIIQFDSCGCCVVVDLETDEKS